MNSVLLQFLERVCLSTLLSKNLLLVSSLILIKSLSIDSKNTQQQSRCSVQTLDSTLDNKYEINFETVLLPQIKSSQGVLSVNHNQGGLSSSSASPCTRVFRCSSDEEYHSKTHFPYSKKVIAIFLSKKIFSNFFLNFF